MPAAERTPPTPIRGIPGSCPDSAHRQHRWEAASVHHPPFHSEPRAANAGRFRHGVTAVMPSAPAATASAITARSAARVRVYIRAPRRRVTAGDNLSD
jgi:hypothetical protein